MDRYEHIRNDHCPLMYARPLGNAEMMSLVGLSNGYAHTPRDKSLTRNIAAPVFDDFFPVPIWHKGNCHTKDAERRWQYHRARSAQLHWYVCVSDTERIRVTHSTESHAPPAVCACARSLSRSLFTNTRNDANQSMQIVHL